MTRRAVRRGRRECGLLLPPPLPAGAPEKKRVSQTRAVPIATRADPFSRRLPCPASQRAPTHSTPPPVVDLLRQFTFNNFLNSSNYLVAYGQTILDQQTLLVQYSGTNGYFAAWCVLARAWVAAIAPRATVRTADARQAVPVELRTWRRARALRRVNRDRAT